MNHFHRYTLNKLLDIKQVISDEEISTISKELGHLDEADQNIIV
jgi:hypothetical protein